MRKTLLLMAIIAAALTSCRQQKELIYFNGLGAETIQNNTAQDVKDYQIKASDILYIRVLSYDQRIKEFFDNSSATSTQQTTTQYQEGGMYYTGYSVDTNGEVEIPHIGKVKVSGMTIDMAREKIAAEVEKSLDNTEIIVKLANRKFTLLGEVNSPGTYVSYNNQTTILEALGMASDLTDYGDRENVLVIRPTENGVTSYRLNLNDKELLSSPYYFMKPNDVVYVQPLKAKGTRMASQDYGVFVSIIGSTLATASIILTLILNLKK